MRDGKTKNRRLRALGWVANDFETFSKISAFSPSLSLNLEIQSHMHLVLIGSSVLVVSLYSSSPLLYRVFCVDFESWSSAESVFDGPVHYCFSSASLSVWPQKTTNRIAMIPSPLS
jgi:hypothetical protein